MVKGTEFTQIKAQGFQGTDDFRVALGRKVVYVWSVRRSNIIVEVKGGQENFKLRYDVIRCTFYKDQF